MYFPFYDLLVSTSLVDQFRTFVEKYKIRQTQDGLYKYILYNVANNLNMQVLERGLLDI